MSNSTTSSLAFLDLLTCGFGGVLMLVLVILALGPQLGKGEPGQIGLRRLNEMSEANSTQPFLILAEFEAKKLNDEVKWQISENGKWQPSHQEIGADFASLIASAPPTNDSTIVLENVPANSEFSIRFFANGKIQEQLPMKCEKVSNIQVWPKAKGP